MTTPNEKQDAATCSRSFLALVQLLEAINRYGEGASLMHPRLTMAISEARKSVEETSVDEECARSPITPPDADEMEGILDRAYQAYRRYNRSIRGQTLTAEDRLEYWAVLEALKWASSANADVDAPAP